MAASSVTTIHFATADTTLGPIVVARSPKGSCAILFGDSRRSLMRDPLCRCGALSCYRWGTDRKRVLLEREAAR